MKLSVSRVWDRRNALFSVPAQSPHGLGATFGPFDDEKPVVNKRVFHHIGYRAIVVNQKALTTV
jgi:hypothetical protein